MCLRELFTCVFVGVRVCVVCVRVCVCVCCLRACVCLRVLFACVRVCVGVRVCVFLLYHQSEFACATKSGLR